MNTRTINTATARPMVASRSTGHQAWALRTAMGPGYQAPITERLIHIATRR